MERKVNLFLKNTKETIEYTSKQSFSRSNIPLRNRGEHGEYVKGRLVDIRRGIEENNQSRQAAGLSLKEGNYIEFTAKEESKLDIRKLEHRTKGIRVLNVKNIADGVNNLMKVVVFIPKGKEGHFLKKVNDYLEEDTDTGKPKNNDLIACIEDIKFAVLESFWQGDVSKIPSDVDEYCEVWLKNDLSETEYKFREIATNCGINVKSQSLVFPERRVLLISANKDKLGCLIEESQDIAEIRRGTTTVDFFVNLGNFNQKDWSDDLLERVYISDNCTSICILDTGVNRENSLIAPFLDDVNCNSVDATWGTEDHHGHGTLMAGLSIYGDLKSLLETTDTVEIKHAIESVKILPPVGSNDEELYGSIVSQAVSISEIENPDVDRIFCMAVTDPNAGEKDGSPSSWSGAIDAISSGVYDGIKRLLIISSGNNFEYGSYPESTLCESVQDPAQAWNALCVGGYTEKDIIQNTMYKDYEPVAPSGGLSPFSTTSLLWEKKWPIKPEIVMESGNLAKNEDFIETCCDDLSCLSTSKNVLTKQFDGINMTSAATGLAACLSAKIKSEYKDIWPETLRALIVHSATWTDTMLKQFITAGSKTEYGRLLRICGYGVPSLDDAIWSYENSVNMIIEEEIQPYIKQGGKKQTKDMHFHELPWPSDVLLGLGEVEVEMKVTLSYFIEPGPGNIGWKNRYRYPSGLLRFDLNRTYESREQFLTRVNAALEDEYDVTPSEGSDNWLIGKNSRDKGSIHSDVWKGTAAELAENKYIAIYPAIGWWRERDWIGKIDNNMRYSLVVSLKTPKQDVELYTEIKNIIDIKIAQEIEIPSV